MTIVYSFHTGAPLNLWERCSLQSFADHGHDTVLFSYDKLDVPAGVRAANAADIIPLAERDRFFAAAPGFFAQFSDYFRYTLLAKHGGWWVDTDVLCRSSTLPSEPVVIGQTQPGKLCNAVMHFPADDPLMREAADYCRDRQDMLPSSHRTVFGPMLMTDLSKSHALKAGPSRLFFPIRGHTVWQFGEPASARAIEAAVRSSPMIHWFQEFFRAAELDRALLPPSGSFLANAFVAHGAANEGHMSLDYYRARSRKGRKAERARQKSAARMAGRLQAIWTLLVGRRAKPQ